MITSVNNSNIKKVVELRDKSRARKKYGLFIAEGLRECMELPYNQIEKVYVSEGFAKASLSDIEFLRDKTEMVSDNVFKYMSGTNTPQGIIGIAKIFTYNIEDFLDGDLYMILENIQDPGNLGTIIRTAEAAGVKLIIMSEDTVDMYNPKVVRATMGGIFRMPCVYSKNLHKDIKLLKSKGIKVYAAHLKGKKSYIECDYDKGAAFMIGNEGNGLREETAELASEYIRIPMMGKTESLNAAVSASILMYNYRINRNNPY